MGKLNYRVTHRMDKETLLKRNLLEKRLLSDLPNLKSPGEIPRTIIHKLYDHQDFYDLFLEKVKIYP